MAEWLEFTETGRPNTPAVRSRRGMHLYFAYHAYDLKYDALSGMELLSDGRSCTAPPSIHETGHLYRWITPLSVPLAPLPDWLIRATTRPPRPVRPPTEIPTGERGERYALGALRNKLQELQMCGERRNDATHLAAWRLREFVPVLGYERIAGELEAVAVSLGLSPTEARGAIRSGLSAQR